MNQILRNLWKIHQIINSFIIMINIHHSSFNLPDCLSPYTSPPSLPYSHPKPLPSKAIPPPGTRSVVYHAVRSKCLCSSSAVRSQCLRGASVVSAILSTTRWIMFVVYQVAVTISVWKFFESTLYIIQRKTSSI